jgi:GTPase
METKQPVPRAILVGIQLDGVDDAAHEASLHELGRLVETLGYEVAGMVSQKRDGIGGLTVLGSGKLAELAAITGGTGIVWGWTVPWKSKARQRFESATTATLPAPEPDSNGRPEFVIVDHEISPSQVRNLENATGAQVLDRTGVIVEIFHRHARSREAKLQVEMARLKYVAPRLRESAMGSERKRGVGTGESDFDLDRRNVRDRLAELRKQLEHIQRDRDLRRSARRDQLRVALVGYTNAGKSSLMRALTGSEVLVADQLFATLDTTVRTLKPEAQPRVLISDTVGFIKQLPHDLIASFKSTLDEALEASLLLFVVDASDPTYQAQLEVTRTVLTEIGADAVPSRLLLNKIDLVDEETRIALLARHPDAILLSSKLPADVAALRETIIAFFEASMVEEELVLPYAKHGLLGDVYENTRVLVEDYDTDGRILKVRGLPGAIARLQRTIAAMCARGLCMMHRTGNRAGVVQQDAAAVRLTSDTSSR